MLFLFFLLCSIRWDCQVLFDIHLPRGFVRAASPAIHCELAMLKRLDLHRSLLYLCLLQLSKHIVHFLIVQKVFSKKILVDSLWHNCHRSLFPFVIMSRGSRLNIVVLIQPRLKGMACASCARCPSHSVLRHVSLKLRRFYSSLGLDISWGVVLSKIINWLLVVINGLL